ncbi:hypothetical protein ACSBR1_003912 [Camellia fascicularis]
MRHQFLNHISLSSEWHPPPSGSFKINCDVATLKGSDQASIVAVLQDSQGKILDGLTQKVSIVSVLQGEALACHLACQLASSLNLSRVEIAGDNKLVIHLSVLESVPPWEYAAMVADIKLMALQFVLSFVQKKKKKRRKCWIKKKKIKKI